MTKFAKLTKAGVIDVISLFPQDGYVEVGEDVFAGFIKQSDGSFAAPVIERVVTPDEVKAEAQRRILAIMPEHTQRNYLAKGLAVMFERDATGRDMTPAETGLLSAGMSAFAQIEAIRATSNEIEALDPIPVDFEDDGYWAD